MQLEKEATLLRKVLSKHPAGLSLSEITDQIRKDWPTPPVTAEKIRFLLQAMTKIEVDGDAYRLHQRSRRADQYYEILQQAGKPLDYRELTRRAVRFGYRGGHDSHSVAVILGGDKRFNVASPRGFWALSEWKHVDTRTFTQIAFDEIRALQRPLHEAELNRLFMSQRGSKPKSIGNLLNANSRFRKIAPKTWALA
jgi:hypothetical protein